MSDASRDIDEQREEIVEFLSRTGAVGVLREVNLMAGSRFTDLEESVDVSSSTLSTRLGEARDLGLLELKLENTEEGTNRHYALTGLGRRVYNQMEQRGIFRTYDKMKTLEEEFDESLHPF